MRQRGSLLIYAIVALAVVGLITAVVVGIYHRGVTAGKAEIRLEWEEANRVQREKEASQAAGAATKLEINRAKQKVVYRTITERVNVEVEKPVYRDGVCLPADGVRIANAALAGAISPAAEPDSGVPAADPAPGWFRGVSPAKDR